MQIPTNFSAAQAVSIASVVSTRDKNVAQTGASPEAATVQAQLEKSESSNPDRDAQGQGDGLGPHDRKRHSPKKQQLPRPTCLNLRTCLLWMHHPTIHLPNSIWFADQLVHRAHMVSQSTKPILGSRKIQRALFPLKL